MRYINSIALNNWSYFRNLDAKRMWFFSHFRGFKYEFWFIRPRFVLYSAAEDFLLLVLPNNKPNIVTIRLLFV